MAALTIPGDTNYDCLIGQSASATIDTYAISNDSTLLIDTDTYYCCSHVGATTGNNGSFDTVSSGMVGKVRIDGTAAKMIPYKGGSGTTPNLFLGLAISSLTYASNVATCTTAAHGLTVGSNVSIRIGGVIGATTTQGYNGVFTGLVTSATVIIYRLAADPGTSTITNARMVYYHKVYQPTGSAITITAASTTGAAAPWIATITTGSAHGLSAGDYVTISGVTPAGYNGNWHVQTIVDTTNFTIWMNATQTAGSAFGTATKNVYSYLLGFFSSFNAAPLPTGVNGAGTVPATGFVKVKNVTGGSFTTGALSIEGGTTPAATAVDHEYPAWIELVAPLTGTCTVARTASFETVGDWFYPRLVPKTSTSITRAGTTATLTLTAHGVTTGSIVTITGASPAGYNGEYAVQNVTANTFDYVMAADPGGSATTQGDFITQICTSGAANQTIQLPAPLTNTYYPGIWIETAVGSNTYEFYPSCNIAAAVGTVATNSAQGELVWISVQGLVRIGNDGTNANGYVPISGLRIRVPNIVTSVTTKALTIGAYPHVAVPATITGRYSLATTGGGVIDLNGINWSWNATLAQAYSVSMVNVGVLDGLGSISEIAAPLIFTNVGIGTSGSGTNAVASFTFSLCFAGGTFTDFIVAGHVATSGTTGQNKSAITDCFNFTFNNWKIQLYPIRRSASSTCCTLTRCNNFTVTGYKAIGARTDLVTCSYITFTGSSYADLTSGTTTTTTPCYRWLLSTNTSNCTFSGDDFFGIANVNPYLGVYNIISAASDIKVRNIGSASSPLSLGPTNAAARFLVGAAGAGSQNLEFKRIYTANTRTSIDTGIDNSYNNIIWENCWFDAADTYSVASLNTLIKGERATNVTTLVGAVYGSHFQDYFDSTTTGKIVIAGNEKTTVEPSASSYSIDTTGIGTGFNSTNAFYMPNVNDQITWTYPWYVIGHKSFSTAAPTITINAVTTSTNINLFYDIDKGSGFTGSFKNLSYRRAGGGGTSGQTNVTMTDTTGVAVNDYVYGTGIGVAAKVQSITNGTTIVVTVANSGTVSGVLNFNQIPNESAIDASVGFKLKVRAKTGTAATTNLLQFIAIPTVVDSTSMAYQYPLDLATITLTNIVVGSRYEIYNVTTSSTLSSGTAATTSVSVTASASVNDTIRIRVRKSSGGGTEYLPFETNATVNASLEASVFVSQVIDTISS
ncbi:MAG: hypothetical protein WAV40_02110 [Microgenomates group bacterium]